jgi:methionyl-tRNA formyltransferase
MSAEAAASNVPGEIIEFASDSKPAGLKVACGDGTVLDLDSLQVEGRKKTSALDFARGARLGTAERFL